MENKKAILNYCPNFERIINTDFADGDNLSLELVRIYKKYIFKIDLNNLDELSNVKKLDQIMGKYVEDYLFRKKFQNEMHYLKVKKNATDVIKSIVEGLIELFKKYEFDFTRKVEISKWI